MRGSRASLLFISIVLAAVCAGCGAGGKSSSNSTVSRIESHLLTASALPAGWIQVRTASADATPKASGNCLPGIPRGHRGWTYRSKSFVQGSSIPTFSEALASGPRVRSAWNRAARELARCRSLTLKLGTLTVKSSLRPVPFPKVGDQSWAYAWSTTIAGMRIGFDTVLFTVGDYGAEVVYADLGTPLTATIAAFARAAAAKVATGHATPISDEFSVASAPVRVAHTSMGTVGYRSVGRGHPLVLIMGYGGSMETWDRTFVDSLAQRYRVYVFDNAGIGPTAMPGKTLSIDTMADQTSALISALGLRHVDALGWSMGSMVAEALAVRHPAQVTRLILCASYPGDGSAVLPTQTAINALNSGNPSVVNAALFPAGGLAAAREFDASLTAYPPAAPASAAVVKAQARAINAWWSGHDPAGHRVATIRLPTLVADGDSDRLDPIANSHRVAAMISGAALHIYPGAGHAFLFQDQSSFVPVIERFLG